MDQEQTIQAQAPELGMILLDLGAALLGAGASCGRIRLNMTRVAAAYQYESHITINPMAITLTLQDANRELAFSGTRNMAGHGINMRLIAGISKLSWSVVEELWPLDKVKAELDRVKQSEHYPRIVVLLFVSLAGSAFCYTFGGKAVEMVITFLATFSGLFIRQQMQRLAFNQYICAYVGAAVASMVAGAFFKTSLAIEPENALATSVLFLIPGVPLINSFTDLIDGFTMNGLVKGFHALVFAMAIAFGLLTAMLIYNIHLL